jgi:alkylation response protein AidB-like acyl-CoA dehydrogenase
MDYKLTEEQEAKKKEFHDFFREEMKNAPKEYLEGGGLEAAYETDEGFAFTLYMRKKLVEKGWLVMAWPEEYGGRDASVTEQVLFSEAYAYHRATGIDGWGVGMFAPSVMLFGTDEQKQRILPPIAKGEVQYCQGWSEPNAGSDLANLSMTAIREGDHYIINGQKIWTTGAHRADHMFILARTDPSQTRSRGLSVFNIVMDTPGIEVRPIKYMNGAHVYNEVFFTDVKVPVDERVGDENDGWNQTRQTMNFERSGVGAYSSMKRTLEALIAYLKTTKRDGKPLSEDPIVRQRLGRIYAEMEAGRALSIKIAWLQEKGNLIFSPAAASESKVHSSELNQKLVNFATEIFGLYGQVERSKWAAMGGRMTNGYQECVGGNIAAGSSEIQRNIIAWVGAELPRFK